MAANRRRKNITVRASFCLDRDCVIFAAHLRPELPQFRVFVTQAILYRVHGGFLPKNFIVFPFCYNPSQLFTAFLYSSVK